MRRQRTIDHPAVVEGAALFSGVASTLTFLPAPENTGVIFVRRGDHGAVQIPAVIENLLAQPRRTSLSAGDAQVQTVEHVLAAAAGLGIDNLIIEASADETPAPDSSAAPYTAALAGAGLVEQQAPLDAFVVSQPLTVTQGSASLTALPGSPDCLDILFDMDYGPICPAIGRQVYGFRVDQDDFAAQLAPARTFLLRAEADQMLAAGVGKHLSPRDVVVVGPDGPIDNTLRFSDELVRHKVADLIGDMALLGRPLRGRLVASRSGHSLNHALVRKLREEIVHQATAAKLVGQPAMDIRAVMKLLPHRYPFLMIDRVLELDGNRRAVAIKNVTINEPFFQGHYPNQPIMPGVLLLEAMAQLSGILLCRQVESAGKMAVLLSLDAVKMRRAVRPGDQLLIEAESLHVRPRTGHCRCKITVAGELACEAEIKFMLIDAQPV
ncbi:MAG: UDP-3-O-acyl-N-acetylglucosamine deacetylase [Planctomycetaceae bacterium]|nr:UDP-3-O-acyl-N-acetylglucosamine deacetylase [Planctomycetaceae bacterium]